MSDGSLKPAAAHATLRQATAAGRRARSASGQIARAAGMHGGGAQQFFQVAAVAFRAARLFLAANEQFELGGTRSATVFVKRHKNGLEKARL